MALFDPLVKKVDEVKRAVIANPKTYAPKVVGPPVPEGPLFRNATELADYARKTGATDLQNKDWWKNSSYKQDAWQILNGQKEDVPLDSPLAGVPAPFSTALATQKDMAKGQAPRSQGPSFVQDVKSFAKEAPGVIKYGLQTSLASLGEFLVTLPKAMYEKAVETKFQAEKSVGANLAKGSAIKEGLVGSPIEAAKYKSQAQRFGSIDVVGETEDQLAGDEVRQFFDGILGSLNAYQQKISKARQDDKPGISNLRELADAAWAGSVSTLEAIGITAMTRNPKLGLMVLAGQEAAPIYNEARSMGKSPSQSAGVATAGGVANYVSEKIGMDMLFKNLKGGIAGTLRSFLSEGLQEGQQQFTSNLIRKVGYKPMQDAFEGVRDSMLAGGFSGSISNAALRLVGADPDANPYQELTDKGAAPGEAHTFVESAKAYLSAKYEALTTAIRGEPFGLGIKDVSGEKDGRPLMEWENGDLSLSELRKKLEIAQEGNEDPDLVQGISKDYDARFAETVVDLTKKNGGLTIRLDGDVPQTGFVVAPSKTTETKIPTKSISRADILEYVNRNMALLEDENAHLGTWVDGENVVLDVSHVYDDAERAVDLAIKSDQDAIFHLDDFTTISRDKYEEARLSYPNQGQVSRTDGSGGGEAAAEQGSQDPRLTEEEEPDIFSSGTEILEDLPIDAQIREQQTQEEIDPTARIERIKTLRGAQTVRQKKAAGTYDEEQPLYEKEGILYVNPKNAFARAERLKALGMLEQVSRKEELGMDVTAAEKAAIGRKAGQNEDVPLDRERTGPSDEERERIIRKGEEALRSILSDRPVKSDAVREMRTVEPAEFKMAGSKFLKFLRQALSPLRYQQKPVQDAFSVWHRKVQTAKELAEKERTVEATHNVSERWKKTIAKAKDSKERKKYKLMSKMEQILDYQNGGGDPNIRTIFDDLFAEARTRGLGVPYRENYLPQVWANTAEAHRAALLRYIEDHDVTPEDAAAIADGLKEVPEDKAKSLRMVPTFTKQRTFANYQDGMNYGLIPKYTDINDLIAYYRYMMEETIANKELAEKLKSGGYVREQDMAPPDWRGLDPPFLRGYYAEKDLANMINGLWRDDDTLDPWQSLRKGAAWLSRKMQEIALSGGVPYTDVNFFAFGQLIKNMTAGDVSVVKAALRANSDEATRKYFDQHQKAVMEMAKQGLRLGRELVRLDPKETATLMDSIAKGFDKAFNERTFKSFIPMMQVQTYEDAKRRFLAKGMEESAAVEEAGKVVQAFYGLIEEAGRGKGTEEGLSFLFFAPKFREGILRVLTNTAKSFTTELNNPAFYMNRRLVLGVVATFISYNLLNWWLNGNWLWENPDGKEFDLRIPYGDGKVFYVPFMPSFLAFPRNMASGAINLVQGNTKVAIQKFSTLLSMPVRLGSELYTGKDYFDRDIYQGDQWDLARMGWYAVKSMWHPYLKEISYQIEHRLDADWNGWTHLPDVTVSKDTQDPWYVGFIRAMELPIKYTTEEKEARNAYYDAKEEKALGKKEFRGKAKDLYDLRQKDLKAWAAAYKKASPEERAAYQSYSSGQKRSATEKAKSNVYGKWKKAKDLEAQGDGKGAQAIFKKLTVEEKKAFLKLNNAFK